MTAGPIILMLACALTLAGAIAVYERLLAVTRAERDDAIADCDLFSELLLEDAARKRHPSHNGGPSLADLHRQYGGGNLRFIAGGE